MITPPPAHACTAWAREGKRRTWPQLQRSAMIYSNLSNATDVVLVYDLNDNETIRSIANVPLVFPSPQLKGHEKNKKIVRLFADLCERLNKAGEASCDDWSGCDIPELVDRFTKALQSWGENCHGCSRWCWERAQSQRIIRRTPESCLATSTPRPRRAPTA